MVNIETDVLVVGTGPAGISAALFLAQLGVDAITISKHPGLSNSPRAHITNQRTMEIFRDAGLEARLLGAATPHHLMGNVSWMTSFTSREIASFRAWGTAPERRADYERASPSPMCNLPQHVMEPIVHAAAIESGADVRFGTELVNFQQNDDGVLAEIVDRRSGERSIVRAKYLIGADGGKSLVANILGIQLEGTAGLGEAVSCWFKADLGPYVEHRPSVLYWLISPGEDDWLGGGTYVCVRPWDEWVLLFVYDPREGEPNLAEATLVERIRRHVGDPSLDVEIKNVGTWTVNHLLAPRYRVNRTFIAGDAAHRHPPANGLGSNTSVQDSYNLCWKLAYVLRGWADPSLLDSYDAERRPIGRQVVDRAITSLQNLRPVMQALGAERDQSPIEGEEALREIFEDSEAGRLRRGQLRDALDLQHWHFNCHGVEMDQFYVSDNIVTEGLPGPAPTRDAEIYHHPTTRPGARLPHAWLAAPDGRRRSTHDLVGKRRFTLIVGIGGGSWRHAARAVSDHLGVPLAVEEIGLGMENADVYGDWARLAEIEEDGALLVRPDAHIAWRAVSAPHDLEAELLQAFSSALGRAHTCNASRLSLPPSPGAAPVDVA